MTIQANAQSFSIQKDNINTDNFPELRVKIQFKKDGQPLKDDFKVFDEDKVELDFEIEKISDENNQTDGRIVFFLIDAASHMENIPIKGVKQAVSETLDRELSENDRINIGYFGKSNISSEGLRLLDNDFMPQSNIAGLKSDLSEILVATSSDSTDSNAYRAMFNALNILDKLPYEGQKMLILLSGAIDYQRATYTPDDVIEESNRLGIPIFTINHLRVNSPLQKTSIYERISAQTGGKSFDVNNTSNIRERLREIFDTRNKQPDNSIQHYEFIFTTNQPADGEEHTFKIAYQEEPSEPTTYTTPPLDGQSTEPPGSFLSNYGPLLILVGLGAVLGIIYYFYNERQIRLQEELEEEEALRAQMEAQEKRKENESQGYIQELKEKNIRLQEQLKLKEQELAKKIDEVPTVIPPEKYDLKNTSISGGGGAPYLQISAGVFSENFRLNKPTITIGRATNNDIIIPEQTVSSKHATITIEKGSFFINDLGSTNGTFVNGSRISSKLLKSGDIIKLGAAHCRFEI